MRYIIYFNALFLLILNFGCSLENSSGVVIEDPIPVDSISIKDSLFKINHMSDYDLKEATAYSLDDVNGDGLLDTAIIYPLTFFVHNEQVDSQFVNIKISCFPKTIKHFDGFKGFIVSIEDLDGDKNNELLYCPDWYQSAWAGIFIYGFKQNSWKLYGSGSIRRDILYESEEPTKYLKNRVKKIDDKSFQIINAVLLENGGFGDSSSVLNLP